MARIDHLVYGVPDLDEAVDSLERQTGVRPQPGGSHPGRGTRNALAALDEGAYLEVLGADPAQNVPAEAWPFALGSVAAPRLVAWAVGVIGIEHRVERARAAGFDPGEIHAMERERPDGVVLRWRATRTAELPMGPVVPFLIDWGDSPHPSLAAPAGLRLVSLSARHPYPERVMDVLAAVGVDLEVTPGSSPGLVAVIDSPKGPMELT
jgi:Glyoxalase-like domain